VTAATIHQRLVDEHCLDASVASLRRWVRANLPEEARRAQVTVLRDTPPAGQEAQIDYGKLGMWCDPRSGRRRTVWAFVMVLAHSRYMFVRPTLVMDQAEWTAAHVEAFAFFGGVPARLVPDYVARHIIGLLFLIELCGPGRCEGCESSRAGGHLLERGT
jgi:transposase